MYYRAKKRKGPEIMIAPLIDCILFLLFFFIATTVFPENLGIQVEKPKAATGKALPKNSLVFAVSKGGEYYFSGDVRTPEEIGEIIRMHVGGSPDAAVVVQVDRQSVTDSLVRFLDMARKAGAKSISIATKPEGEK